MKNKKLVLILILTILALSLLAEDGAEKKDWNRIYREMDFRGALEKQALNFAGNVKYRSETMVLYELEGKFRDIVIADMSDYHVVVTAFDTILRRLLPYIGAREGQCTKYFISVDRNNATVQYSQQAYGYRAGSLDIFYYSNSGVFKINNWTKSVPFDEPGPVINKQEALNIANKDIDRDHAFGPRGIGLEYIYPTSKSTVASLCYEFNNQFYYVLLDAVTGEVLTRNKKEWF